MLLYATRLFTRETLTWEAFVELVLEWNRTSPYEENKIPGLVWKGEENIRWGNERVWMELASLPEQALAGVRYEKKDAQGTIWTTDYVADFRNRELVVQLDRTYTEEALRESLAFATPHFITMLMEKGYLAPDGNLPVQKGPVVIRTENLDRIRDCVAKKDGHRLPLVYLSRTGQGEPAVDARWLGSKLKGAAHLLVADRELSRNRLLETGLAEQNGAVGIYLPHRHLSLGYGNTEEAGKRLLEETARTVLEYGNTEDIPQNLTWNGVKQALLDRRFREQAAAREKTEQALEESRQEIQDFMEAFDQDQEALQQQNQELSRENQSLRQEILGLRKRMNRQAGEPVLCRGQEKDLYSGELREILQDVLEEALKKGCQPGTRRYDVLQDIHTSNLYDHVREKRKEALKKVLKGYKTLTPAIRRVLEDMGITITGEGKHYRLTYYGDERYKDTMSKTGSDSREGLNKVQQIVSKMM